MRLVKLELRAFGPFGGCQEIDFEALGEEGIFLITGPTGAGKTTLFDGVMFALYGRASGDRRQPEQFRSDFAEETAVCSAALEFAIRGERYRIERQPQQVRQNAKGRYVTVKAGAVLTGPKGEVLSKIREVDARVVELVGLTAEQFRQIVLLPQGEFRKLLDSSSAEKQEIFRRIFGTQKFSRLEDLLREQAGEAQAKMEELTVRLQVEREKIACAPGSLLEGLCRAEYPDYDAILQQLEESLQAAQGELERAAARRQEVAARHRALDPDALARQNQGIAALAIAKAEWAAWQAEGPLQSQREEALDLARRAELCRQAMRRAKEAAERAESARRQAKEAARALAENRPRWEAAQAGAEALLGQETARTAALRRAEALRGQQEQARRRERVEGELARCERTLQRLGQLQTYLQLRDRRQEGEEQRRALTALREAALARGEAETALAEAQRRAQEESRRHLQGQAALLAEGLTPGAPCPVCGATHHPAPARAGGEIPTAAQLEETAARVEALRRRAEGARAEEAACRAALPAALQGVQDLPAQDAALKDELALLAAEERQLADQVAAFIPLDQLAAKGLDTPAGCELAASRQQSRREALEEERGQLADLPLPHQLEGEAAAAEAEAKTLAEQIAARRDAFSRAQERQASLQKAVDIYAESAREAAAAAEAEEETARQQFARQGLRADALPQGGEEEIRRLEGEIAAYRERGAQWRARLEGLAEYEGKTPCDLEEAARRSEQLAAEEEALERQLSEGQVALAQNGGCREAIAALLAQRDRWGEGYRDAVDLYRVASGQNAKKLSFERYVLSAYFDQVVRAANRRFAGMTEGKYTLLRRTEREKGNRASGLDLEVLDSLTGKTRHVNTLSGGESFQASLSLALGLADVIQLFSGGVSLETVFIDEGFGSLDAEALECAVDTLERLRREDRVVGIISHVEWLEERLPVALAVRPLPGGGSRASVRRGGRESD